MKKVNDFFSDLLEGFKKLFSSTHNVKLVLLMVLAAFLVVYIALGGCGRGLSLCGGGADADVEQPPKQASSCAGSGSRGEDVYAEGLHNYDGFTETTVSCTDLIVYGHDVRASVYYPTELFTLDQERKAYFGNCVLVGPNGYNLEIGADYTGVVSYNGSSAQNFDEMCQGIIDNTIKDNYTVCEKLTVDGRNAIATMSRNGFARVYVDCSDIYEKAVVEFCAVPDEFGVSEDLGRKDAANAFYDEQIQALIHTAVITPADMVPWLDENGNPNMNISFKTYADGRVQKAGHSFEAPVVSVGDVFEDISFEAENCKVEVLSAERVPILEEFKSGWRRGLIDVKLVFTNNSENPEYLEDIFYIEAENGRGVRFDRHLANYDHLRVIEPGECILVNFRFDSLGDNEDFFLHWRTYNNDTEEWELAGKQILLEGK